LHEKIAKSVMVQAAEVSQNRCNMKLIFGALARRLWSGVSVERGKHPFTGSVCSSFLTGICHVFQFSLVGLGWIWLD
jgi:hypothetical protein